MSDYVEQVTGEVTDVVGYEESDDYVVPTAALYNWHPGQELVAVDDSPDADLSVPAVRWYLKALSNVITSPLWYLIGRTPILGWSEPLVLVPAGSVSVGEEIDLRAKPVVNHTAAGYHRAERVYRAASVGGVSV